MEIDDKLFEAWMERLMERFDRQDARMDGIAACQNTVDGEPIYDNQELCQMLNVSKRTLQRYRSSGELEYEMNKHKVYYRKSAVDAFLKLNFERNLPRSLFNPDNKRK